MRSLLTALSFVLAALACAACTPPEASVPLEEERPCRNDADCQMHGADPAPRRAFCSSRVAGRGEKDDAACGPMANMTPSLSEPVLACFRGTCVPIGSAR